MNRLPAYVRALSNDDLIWNRLKERGHRFRRSLGVSVFGCFELPSSSIASAPLIAPRSLAAYGSSNPWQLPWQTDDGDCVKCLVKLWLFATRIAGQAFPAHSHRYLCLAKSLVPPRPILWSFASLQEEIDWYIKCVGAEGRDIA